MAELSVLDANQPKVFERAKPTTVQNRIWEIIGAAAPGSLVMIGYGGAAGGGKTRGLCELAIDLATDFPGAQILIGRKDYSDLRDTTMTQFNLACPPSLIVGRNQQEHWVDLRLAEWPEGVKSRIIFRELKDYLGIASAEYTHILFDEAGEIPVNSALMGLSRLRARLPDSVMKARYNKDTCPWGRTGSRYPDGMPVTYVFYAASNPWPGWFKQWFVDRQLPEDVLRQFQAQVHFLPARAKDNPFLPKDYEARLRAIYPEDWVRRLMDGRWDAFVGQVYPMFSSLTHEWRWPLPKPSQVERVVGGLDFGGQNPHAHMSAGVVALLTKSHRLIRVAEFEDRGLHIVQRQMSWMMEQQALWQYRGLGPIHWKADRSQMLGIELWRRTGSFNVSPTKGGPDSVEMGIANVARRFEPDENGLPGSYYVPAGAGVLDWNGQKLPGLSKFPARVSAYRYAEPKEDQPAKAEPIKVDDDLCDADRYMGEAVDRIVGNPQQLRRGLAVVGSAYARQFIKTSL